MKHLVLTSAALLTCASYAGALELIMAPLGQLGPGTSITAELAFVSGEEVYVGFFGLPDGVAPGDGVGFSAWTEGEADTEIAIYGSRGFYLHGCNDDGHSGSWGNPGFNSRLDYGDAEGAPSNGDGWNGYTVQNTDEYTNLDNIPAGAYTIIVSTYSTIWDEIDALDSEQGARDTGSTTAHLEIYEVE